MLHPIYFMTYNNPFILDISLPFEQLPRVATIEILKTSKTNRLQHLHCCYNLKQFHVIGAFITVFEY